MDRFSTRFVIVLSGVVALAAGCCGALLALAIDEPDVVVSERIVEVQAPPPLARPSPEDLASLTDRYDERTGVDDASTASLVDEVGALVCDGGYTSAQVGSALGADLALAGPELDDFVEEVRSLCPAR